MRKRRRSVHIGKYNIGPYLSAWLLESQVLGVCAVRFLGEDGRIECCPHLGPKCPFLVGKYRNNGTETNPCAQRFIHKYIVLPDGERG